ncbi:SRPBCC family protein [bacterium]|nr:SRPBCC family protein [bacterium]
MVIITKENDGYKLTSEKWANKPLKEVFSFFAEAQNLEKMTPAWLNFSIITPPPIVMKEGLLIDYKIKLFGVPMKWKTLISRWEPGKCFVDEQLKGPYKKWIHLHSFESSKGGTVCRDEVAFYPLGGALTMPFVGFNLRKIFEYRGRVMDKIFA